MIVTDFKPEHLLSIEPQPAQMDAMGSLTIEHGKMFIDKGGKAVTGIADGITMFCCGYVPIWRGRWLGWSLISKYIGTKMVWMIRVMRRSLDAHDQPGRIEIIVRDNFPQGRRMAEMLGFRFHHHEEKFLPDGSNADIFVRFY